MWPLMHWNVSAGLNNKCYMYASMYGVQMSISYGICITLWWNECMSIFRFLYFWTFYIESISECFKGYHPQKFWIEVVLIRTAFGLFMHIKRYVCIFPWLLVSKYCCEPAWKEGSWFQLLMWPAAFYVPNSRTFSIFNFYGLGRIFLTYWLISDLTQVETWE